MFQLKGYLTMLEHARSFCRASLLVLLLLGATTATLFLPRQAQAISAPDNHSVLILGSTVTGGAGSLEATQAASLGLTVVVASDADWAATTAAEFATFRALVMGDPTCVGGTGPIAAAEANRATWGAAVGGNVIVVGTDPAYHAGGQPGAVTLTNKCIAFAAADAGKTGAYVCLSCYYYAASSGTPVNVLDPFGTFTVVGQGGCPANSHIIATHPAITGLTDAALSNWGCSTHEGFVSWPVSFDPLAISLDVPSTFVAGDGTTGAPYIMARGATILSHICLTPGEATNPLDTDHTVTAFVNSQLDCAGNPVAGKLVTFLVIDGPNNGVTGTATTGADGKCTFTYHGLVAGTDIIQASFLNEAGGREYTRAIKHWGGGGCTGPGHIECPDNIKVRCYDPDGAVVEFPMPKAFDCDGKPLPVVCTKESGTWFHTGLTRIECFGPDDPSGDCLYCSFDVEVEPSECPQTTPFWAGHPGSWPVTTLKLGCKSYNAAQLLTMLAYSGTSDASMILARELAAVKLNLAHCTDPCPIADVVVQADCAIDCRTLPADVSPTSALGITMLGLAQTLAEYNEGLLTPRCSPDKALVQVDALGQSGLEFRMNPALPNPFSGPTSLVFTLPSAADARLSVFDLQGREVKVLLKGALPAGRHSAVWNGTDETGARVANGVYFARLTMGGNRTLMQRLVKLN